MRDIYNLFQYYKRHENHLTEEKILDRAKEKLSKNLFTHQEFYIAVEKESKPAEGTELPVHLDEAEFNSRIYICLSKISVHMAKKRFGDDSIIFVPVSRDEVLRIVNLGKTMPYFNIYFLIHGREIIFTAEKVFDSMTKERRFLFFDLSKVNHYVPFLFCKINVFLIFAALILWIYPLINPFFLNEIGTKDNPLKHRKECYSGRTITRYRGDAKNLYLKRPSEEYYGNYCLGRHAFHDNPVIETITLDFEYYPEHLFKNFRSIHRYAFYNCPNLRRIDLPYGLEKIFCVAFCDLPSLESLFIPPTVTDLSDGEIYANCPNLKTVYITESLYRKYEEDFTKRNKRDNITVEYIFIDELEESESEEKK